MNPRTPAGQAPEAIGLEDFKNWVYTKYSRSWAVSVFVYARKYRHLLNNARDIEYLPKTIRTNVVKSLSILAKYEGCYDGFRTQLKNYGIKIIRQDSLASFIRLFNNRSSDVLQWLKSIDDLLNSSERLVLRFCLLTGLRKVEAMTSFNLIIKLHRENRLSEYYDSNLSVLQHYQFRDIFLRKTKNCYISFVSGKLTEQIASSEPVSYKTIYNKLQQHSIKCRINELRDFYGTFLVKKGITSYEVDLLQGRISPEIFIRHYFSPSITELRDRIFKALAELEQTILLSFSLSR